MDAPGDPAPRSTLPVRWKIGYGTAEIGASLAFATVSTWLLFFLVNVARLDPLLAGALFVAGRLVDAALDPIMGSLSDRVRSRWGRKRFIAWGALPLGAGFALLWAIPAEGPTLLLALGALLLFSVLYTIVQMPYLALTPELAPDYDERTRLGSYRAAFGTIASMLAFAAPPLVVGLFSSGTSLADSSPVGWRVMGIGFGALIAVSYLVMTAVVPEPDRPAPLRPARTGDLGSLLRVTGFREVLALFVAVTIGVMIVSSILPFYLESALGLPPGQQSLILGLLFGSAIASFPLWNALSGRLGKRGALVVGLLLLGGSLVALVLVAREGITPGLVALTVVAGAGVSAQLLLPWAMLPDVVEFDTLANGTRREGLIYALFTFAQKTAGSVGVFANGLVTGLLGYQAGAASQDPATVLGIRWMVGPVAALVFLAALLLTLRYPITRRLHAEARRELAAQERETAS